MRPIILRYAGECRTCDAILSIGSSALYEKRVGVFCPPCAPTDPEDIRGYRQAAADRRADRYEDWARKRRDKATELEAQNAPFGGDHAFNTQPGHIPERVRALARTEQAWEHRELAGSFEAKADRLRHSVRVAGDAEARRQARRDLVRAVLRVGMRVHTGIYGLGIVEKINKKTATIGSTGRSGSFQTTVDLSFLKPLESQ